MDFLNKVESSLRHINSTRKERIIYILANKLLYKFRPKILSNLDQVEYNLSTYQYEFYIDMCDHFLEWLLTFDEFIDFVMNFYGNHFNDSVYFSLNECIIRHVNFTVFYFKYN